MRPNPWESRFPVLSLWYYTHFLAIQGRAASKVETYGADPARHPGPVMKRPDFAKF